MHKNLHQMGLHQTFFIVVALHYQEGSWRKSKCKQFCNFAGNFIPKSAPPHLWTTKPYSTTRVPLQRTSATTIQTTTCLRNRYNHFWLDQASSNTRSNASVYLGSFLWKKIFSSKYKSKYKLHQQWPAEKESTKIPVRLRTN